MTIRKRPAPGDRPSPESSAEDFINRTADRWHSTPTVDERREAQLLSELRNLGYTVSVPCLMCGHPLTSDRSTARHIGPKCFTKAVS